MAASAIIAVLEKLLTLHQDLYDIAKRKTIIIKYGELEALNQVMKDENKIIVAIQLAEKEREKAILLLSKGDPVRGTPSTILECLDWIDEKSDQEKIVELRSMLLDTIEVLKDINNLNQQLLEQSMQFVRLNLDLFSPESNLDNYSKTANEESETIRSFFDSKA
ncbi:flagellar protein FlgN [Cytobacillus dafuensis]|uniref:Flagellar protein FlgN n=1 Tax=Cytobacillus dafuensis TaxID=1742359 RepID=A0A5B8Z905_CYTDA|nr:flagellar protein FlgN [Cytobacillus dafuensis]QED49602.1 flagellar protein FlgN [Cytobacillus dafuensis]